MSDDCYPVSALPHVSQLYRDYVTMSDAAPDSPLRRWFREPDDSASNVPADRREALADLLTRQNAIFGGGEVTQANIARLRKGARAIVTGQQVGLFGGPLLTLLKAATAIARAKSATARTGVPHVPIFWMATEDHDLAEVDQISLPGRTTLEQISLGLKLPHAVPVGGVVMEGVEAALEQVRELVGGGPAMDLLDRCYTAGSTLSAAFGRWMAQLFHAHGLIVIDAAERESHRLGAETLRFAIEHADELEQALLNRTKEIEAAGYAAQVLVVPGHSLVFLVQANTGTRLPLRRTKDGNWRAGPESYTTAALLDILGQTPERISPNALLRPVFQDTILPTAAYIGGPAEIAYFAQAEVLYQAILGHVTPVLPRFSATLIQPTYADLLRRHDLQLRDLFSAKTADSLTQRLGARMMPIPLKRKLSATGQALDTELSALIGHMSGMDAGLGKSALVAGNKMRYQMNRLRRMAAAFEVQKEASLRRHAEALMLHLFPHDHLQERFLGGIWFLAQAPEGLLDQLVQEAATSCPGHAIICL